MNIQMDFSLEELAVLRKAMVMYSNYLGEQTDRAYRNNYKSLPLKEAREDFADALLGRITDKYRGR